MATVLPIISLLPDAARDLYTMILKELEPLLADKSWKEAMARVDMFLKGVPGDQDNRLLRAALMAQRGAIALELEDYATAEEDIRHAIHNGLKHPSVYTLAGWAAYETDEADSAKGYFNKALEADPRSLDALRGLALLALDEDDYEGAIAELSRALELEPGQAGLWGMRAEAYAYADELEAAEQDNAKARELAPGDADWALMAARLCFVARGDTDGALKALGEAIKGGEPALEALLLRSQLRLMLDQPKEAREDAAQAVRAYPEEAFAHIQLGLIHVAQRNASMGLRASEKAIALDATIPDAYLVRGAARRLKGEEDEAAYSADFARGSSQHAELPAFLFGPCYGSLDAESFEAATLELLEGQTAPVAAPPAAAAGGMPGGFPGMPGLGGLGGLGGLPGMGGMDPMKLMGQMFDEEGNIRPMFRPVIEMALRNAPAMLKNMPPSMLKNSGMDPEALAGIDFSKMTSAQLEEQMKAMFKAMKQGGGDK
jgi:tetratricopeptide (TPR) repeat protein